MYGLALEGGGAKGAYHVGAYKAILQEGLDISSIVGTSVGALNGAIFCQGDLLKAEELWRNISNSHVMELDDEKIQALKSGRLGKEDLVGLVGDLKEILLAGGIEINPLKELLDGFIDETRLRASEIDFGMVTVSLTDLKGLEIFIEDIEEGKLKDYLLASAYFPLFKRESLDGKTYMDGGVYNNLPIDLLKSKGYKDIIQVRTFGPGHIKKTDTRDLNIISIEPMENLGPTLDFDPERASYNIDLGYFDGLKALRNLKGQAYYIDTAMDDDHIFSYLLDLSQAKRELLVRLFRLDDTRPWRRNLFEDIVPKLADLVEADSQAGYLDIFIGLLEKLALVYGLERFRIYGLEEMASIVRQEIIRDYASQSKEKNRLRSKIDFLAFLNKEQVLKELGFILF